MVGYAGFLLLAAACSAAAGITPLKDGVRITAGPLTRTLRVTPSGVRTVGLTVEGRALLGGPASDVSVVVSQASPNRQPPLLKPDIVPARDWQKAEAAGEPPQDVRWVLPSPAVFSGAAYQITHPAAGVTRVSVSAGAPALSLTIHYEIYGDYPAIRKWVELRNTGRQWRKIDRLTIDDVHFAPAYAHALPLTPAERGAGASVVAFGSADRATGVIAGNEVPSALRYIAGDGAMGYSAEHFEWVLGPGERFVSEPVFLFAFSGPVEQTISAASTPLDRALEGAFQRFLVERVGVAAAGLKDLPAPQWVSWSNFRDKIDDAIVREQAAIAAKAGFKTISLDQGWQKGLLGTEPDPVKFPDFAATSQYVRSLGLRLGAWVSCFRTPGSPDLAALPDGPSVPIRTRQGGMGMSFSSAWADYYAGDLAAVARRYGITYFKQDFTNIRLGDLREGHAARTRKESLLRGLRGLLRAQDAIRQAAPEVATEITHEIYWGTPGVPCDLAAVKHSALYHIPPNDYSGVGHPGRRYNKDAPYDPQKMRAALVRGCFNARERFYAHRALPLYAIEYYGAATMNIGGSLTPEVQDRQVCSWLMGASQVFAGDLASLTPENIAHYRRRFELLARLEKTYGIYRVFQFSGVPAPTDEDWHWWGKLNRQGTGAVVVLRGRGGEPSRPVNIPWVEAGRHYRVTALLTGKPLGEFPGKRLQAGALRLELPVLGQEILEVSLVP